MNIIDGKQWEIISDKPVLQKVTGQPLGEHCTRVQTIQWGDEIHEAAWFHDDNGKLITVTSRRIS